MMIKNKYVQASINKNYNILFFFFKSMVCSFEEVDLGRS